MNNLQIFENKEFGSVRTLMVNDEPYFMGKDVAEILGYQNGSRDINRHVDDEDKITERIVLSGQNREVIFINESGLYSLILSSKMPNAKKFKRWVTAEILPSIRKHGGYLTPQKIEEVLMNPDTIIKLATDLKMEREKRKALEIKVEQDKPKTIFADAVNASDTSILVGDLAKLICQNGVKIGQKRLFEWLRQNNYLIKRGSSRNMPQQRYVEQGLFEVKERNVQNPDGSVRITRTTLITGKGQIYFVNKFFKKETKEG